MLEFFRRYQQYFFIIITVVIVISFSFFGTYNALPSNDVRDVTAFRAIDGTAVSRADLNDMAQFLSTDMDDKLYFGGSWGPNFLNNGIIKNLFLQNGLAELLVSQYAGNLAPDFEKRSEIEKRFSLYTHPQAKFISTEAAWSYLAPSMLTDYKILKETTDPLSPDAFAARIRLYLAERNLSSSMLQNFLYYQQSQYSWITPDPNLGRMDLSLFGYHTLSDWFGYRFVNLATEFIYNSAKVAELRGYRVSKSEALADLMTNATLSYKQNLQSPHLGVANVQEYFREQLRRMGMDQNRAIKIWQNALLASRMFEEAGHSVLVSPEIFASFVNYSREPVKGDLYQLPKELKLGDYSALQKFEVYLDAVAARSAEEKKSLVLPEKFLTANEIAHKYPELLQKQYDLEIAQVERKDILPKIRIADMLAWEVEDSNWTQLQKKFPDIGIQIAATKQERLTVLDNLNDKARARVDAFARKEILEARPELIANALDAKPMSRMEVGLSLKGPAGMPFEGVEDGSKLIALLDKASTENSDESASEQAVDQQLEHFTADQVHYYKIKVIRRYPNEKILTFAEANRQGILDRLVEATLKTHYKKMQITDSKNLLKADGSPKDFADVKQQVADNYFANILKAIQAENDSKTDLTGDQAAPRRLLSYVKMVQKKVEENPDSPSNYFKNHNSIISSADKEDNAKILAQQWQLEKRPFLIDRSNNAESINSEEALKLSPHSWSTVAQSPTGALSFYQKLESDPNDESELIQEKNEQSQKLISGEAQRKVASQLIEEFRSNDALSLSFMDSSSEMTVPD